MIRCLPPPLLLHNTNHANGVACRYDAPRSQIDELLSSVSAVLFTGGELVLDLDTPYMQQANYIFQTVKARDQSNPATRLILWGTCMGTYHTDES